MTPFVTVPVFVLSLAVTLGGAGFFARRLDRVGSRLGLPEAVIGLLTALAADGPEITSALVALAKGAGAVSLGVLIGSNIFNLAAMIGLSAVLAGHVRLRRETLVLEGGVGLFVTLLASALVVGFLSPALAAVALTCVLVPYVALLLRGSSLARRLGLGDPVVAAFDRALPGGHDPQAEREEHVGPLWRLAVLVPLDLALIILGSTAMVECALSLSGRWHASRDLVGVLVLGPLTSLPNAFTAVRLGLARRDAALVSESTNSNTINLFAGVVLPALFVGVARATTGVKLQLAWLLAMTLFTLLVLARRRGMSRLTGAVLIAFYVVFVLAELLFH
jgi:cation:H+ antiporter